MGVGLAAAGPLLEAAPRHAGSDPALPGAAPV